MKRREMNEWTGDKETVSETIKDGLKEGQREHTRLRRCASRRPLNSKNCLTHHALEQMASNQSYWTGYSYTPKHRDVKMKTYCDSVSHWPVSTNVGNYFSFFA